MAFTEVTAAFPATLDTWGLMRKPRSGAASALLALVGHI